MNSGADPAGSGCECRDGITGLAATMFACWNEVYLDGPLPMWGGVFLRPQGNFEWQLHGN
jgi:hypothetical protein